MFLSTCLYKVISSQLIISLGDTQHADFLGAHNFSGSQVPILVLKTLIPVTRVEEFCGRCEDKGTS